MATRGMVGAGALGDWLRYVFQFLLSEVPFPYMGIFGTLATTIRILLFLLYFPVF